MTIGKGIPGINRYPLSFGKNRGRISLRDFLDKENVLY
jgi:hypothetical protein